MVDFTFLRTVPVSLQRYLPPFLYRDPQFKAVQDALGGEHETQRLTAIDVTKQMFVSTATWGLDDWEEFVGIDTNKALDYQSRRRAILAKLNGTQTVTLDFLITLVNLFVANKSGIVIDHPEGYEIEVRLPDGRVTSFTNLEKALHLFVPAHIGWKYIGYARAEGGVHVGGIVSSYIRTTINADTTFDVIFAPAHMAVVGIVRSAVVTRIEADRYK